MNSPCLSSIFLAKNTMSSIVTASTLCRPRAGWFLAIFSLTVPTKATISCTARTALPSDDADISSFSLRGLAFLAARSSCAWSLSASSRSAASVPWDVGSDGFFVLRFLRPFGGCDDDVVIVATPPTVARTHGRFSSSELSISEMQGAMMVFLIFFLGVASLAPPVFFAAGFRSRSASSLSSVSLSIMMTSFVLARRRRLWRLPCFGEMFIFAGHHYH
mmetsp:Transcript_15713/g.37757  ORF Transcript_15713/g.37757 Transcript_15713/m.37757 type:complete len:218 (+) Transcript_15713:1210-1863(+)